MSQTNVQIKCCTAHPNYLSSSNKRFQHVLANDMCTYTGRVPKFIHISNHVAKDVQRKLIQPSTSNLLLCQSSLDFMRVLYLYLNLKCC